MRNYGRKVDLNFYASEREGESGDWAPGQGRAKQGWAAGKGQARPGNARGVRAWRVGCVSGRGCACCARVEVCWGSKDSACL